MDDRQEAQGMMETMQLMQKRGEFCDIFLLAGVERQPAHRCVLSSRSQLLRKRFLGERTRDGTDSVEIDGLSGESLQHFIHFVYTGSLGKVELPFRVVDEVLQVAQNLEMTFDKQIVLEYFRQFIQYSQFNLVLDLASQTNIRELRDFALGFATDNIAEFMVEGRQTFCNLQLEELTDILSRREMQEISPRIQAKAVILWCINEFHQQVECLDILLHYVTVNRSTRGHLLAEIQRLTDSDAEYSDYLDLIDRLFDNDASMHDSTFNCDSVIFITGGEGENSEPSDRMLLYDPKENSIVHQTHLPSKCLDHSATVINGKLYLAGGQRSNNSKSKDSSNQFYSFDPDTNEWSSLPSMQKSRSVFSLVALDHKIYAVAGKNSQGSLASVECYDTRNNAWSYVSHTYTGLFGHAGTSFCGMLFISGGVVAGRHFTYSLQCYKPKIDKWIHMAPMTHKRAFHAMCTVGDKLYATGGNTCDQSGRRVDCDFVERYCPDSDQWSFLISMPRPVSLAGTAAFDGKIFVVGGYSGKRGQKFSEIQRYHVKRKQWSIVCSLPATVMRLASCSSKS